MKIVFASDTFYPTVNGAAYFTYHLAQAMTKKGHEVHAIAPGSTALYTVSQDGALTIHGVGSVPVPIYPGLRAPAPPLARHTIKKILSEVKPDVVHVHFHMTVGKETIRAAKELGIPVVATNHFMPENWAHYFHLPQAAETAFKKFGWKQFRAVYEQADLVTTPTRAAANLLHEIGLKQEVVPVSCGIDLTRFHAGDKDEDLKRRYGIPLDRPVLLYVGRLDYEKNVHVTFKALAKIIKECPAHLVLVGIGKDKENLEQLGLELGIKDNVSFTGFVPNDDLPVLYRSADVFVIASIAELQSIVTLEAMASGLPVIAANAIALPELCHDNENGFVFPPGDSDALAEKLRQILTDNELRARMSAKSLEIVQAHDFNRTVATYEEIYKKAIERQVAPQN